MSQLHDLWLEAVPASRFEEVYEVQGAAVLQRILPERALEASAQEALQEIDVWQERHLRPSSIF